MKLKLQDLIMTFLRENGLKLTDRYLEEDRSNKLIRFVKGNNRYSIVFSGNGPILHLFKEKISRRRPYGNVATVHGRRKSSGLSFNQAKIKVDLSDKESFKQILDFL